MAGEYLHFYGAYRGKAEIADPHFHTDYSDGMLSPQRAVKWAAKNGLHTIVVADHNTREGALRAQEHAQKTNARVKVVVGEEVTSKRGHILGVNLTEDIPKGLSVEDTIARIKEQGGLVIIPHPDQPNAYGLSLEKDVEPLIGTDYSPHGIEVINANLRRAQHVPVLGRRLYPVDSQRQTRHFIGRYNREFAVIGGSDSHGLALAHAATAFDGDDFLQAVKDRQTSAIARYDLFKHGIVDMFFQVYTAYIRDKVRKIKYKV